MQEAIYLNSNDEAFMLFGASDKNLKAIRKKFGVKIVARGGIIKIEGKDPGVIAATRTLNIWLDKIRKRGTLPRMDVERTLKEGNFSGEKVAIFDPDDRHSRFRPRSEGQRKYLKTIEENDITISIGPAGTGKTFLAVLAAIRALEEGRARKIVLVRPAVEAEEKLGFLPGDYKEKVNPYLKPLYDALYEILDYDKVKRLLDKEVIEIIPLAYMRGRTLGDAFVILDEAQNTTMGQMKMFLTRMGENSKIVVTGDITQIDLPKGTSSGLVESQEILKDIKGIAFCYTTGEDIVRHFLVEKILDAYGGAKNTK